MTASRGKRFLRALLTYGAIVVVTLVLLDVALMVTGLFPLRLDYGDPQLGWRPAAATGRMALGRCLDVATGKVIDYRRNEDGVRTSLSKAELMGDSTSAKIGVIGDSQTELCAPNAELHAGVLQATLDSQGIRSVALPYGAGKYSPVQAYLAFRLVLKPYAPKVMILNLYTGNDLYDILRVDDRPHFDATDSGYVLAPPVWYSRDDPKVRYRSRVLFAIRTMAEKVGIRRLYLRVQELNRVARQQGAGYGTVIGYMRDLYKAREPSVGYPDAFTSQMLNQQLFFHRFPHSKAESMRRIEALMKLIRQENPGLILVMSPLPSYELVGEQPVDSALIRTLSRVSITREDGVREEGELYDRMHTLAREQQWLFVDNLAALNGYSGTARLYNDYDYHLTPEASALVGKAQAAVLADTLRKLQH